MRPIAFAYNAYRRQMWPVYGIFQTRRPSAALSVAHLHRFCRPHPQNLVLCALNIEIGHCQSVILNEFAARLNKITHQLGKDVIGLIGLVDLYL